MPVEVGGIGLVAKAERDQESGKEIKQIKKKKKKVLQDTNGMVPIKRKLNKIKTTGI